MNNRISFPKNFNFGVAASAYQIEGGNYYNDWYEFEKEQNLEPAGRATDHWNKYKEDFQLLKELNVDSYRISVEWSRLFPESPDKVNKQACP